MTAHANPSDIQAGPPVAGQKLVNLALQGVGGHGAFTWGVLDRLLEEERLALDGISATSAGAVNAVVLAYGLAVGGREGAKGSLDRYWRRLPKWHPSASFNLPCSTRCTEISVSIIRRATCLSILSVKFSRPINSIR
jgi:predicted acylesterase/phospholipase RssA